MRLDHSVISTESGACTPGSAFPRVPAFTATDLQWTHVAEPTRPVQRPRADSGRHPGLVREPATKRTTIVMSATTSNRWMSPPPT